MIRTARLTLREFNTGDALFVLRLLNEPSFVQNIGDRGVRTPEQAVKYLENGPLASYAKYGLGLMMVLRGETPIGMCGLIQREGQPDIDVGYAFVPEAWGQGFAYEAVEATLASARAPRVAAFVSPGNERSIRLLKKFGFKDHGRAQLSPGAPEALVLLRTTEPAGR